MIEENVRFTIRGCDVLIADTPRVEESAGHIGVAGAVALAREAGAKRLVLTHLGPAITAEAAARITAEHPWVTFAYDGLIIEL